MALNGYLSLLHLIHYFLEVLETDLPFLVEVELPSEVTNYIIIR